MNQHIVFDNIGIIITMLVAVGLFATEQYSLGFIALCIELVFVKLTLMD